MRVLGVASLSYTSYRSVGSPSRTVAYMSFTVPDPTMDVVYVY